MRYYVMGDDGMRYGPADVQLLQMWANEGRVRPDHMLQLETGGQPIQAVTIIGLHFHQLSSPYQQPQQPTPTGIYTNPYAAYPRQPNGGYGSYGAIELRFAWACAIGSVILMLACSGLLSVCAALAGIGLSMVATRRGQRATGPVALSLVVLVLATLGYLVGHMIR